MIAFQNEKNKKNKEKFEKFVERKKENDALIYKIQALTLRNLP